MSYKWLNGYTTTLTEKLDKASGLLPIDDARALAEKLDADHTYLILNDSTGAEIVKATAFGNQVKIERGQGDTVAKTFPQGTCVKWETTQMGVEETICSADCSEKETDCGCE